MKTIEEASSEAISDRTISVEELFDAGVEFAQRWISVEDEFPPMGKVILLKFDDDYTQISTGIYNGTEFINDFGFDEERCTHWRPIEYK